MIKCYIIYLIKPRFTAVLISSWHAEQNFHCVLPWCIVTLMSNHVFAKIFCTFHLVTWKPRLSWAKFQYEVWCNCLRPAQYNTRELSLSLNWTWLHTVWGQLLLSKAIHCTKLSLEKKMMHRKLAVNSLNLKCYWWRFSSFNIC